jgi:hypothetical protein
MLHVNKQLVLHCYRKTGVMIQHQNERDLSIVFQYIYNRDFHSTATLDFLNEQVLEELKNNVEQSLRLHLHYLQKLENVNMVNDRPFYQDNRNQLINKRII